MEPCRIVKQTHHALLVELEQIHWCRCIFYKTQVLPDGLLNSSWDDFMQIRHLFSEHYFMVYLKHLTYVRDQGLVFSGNIHL